MGMSLERSQFAKLVVQKLLTCQAEHLPYNANELMQEMVELLDLHHQTQMKLLQEIHHLLANQYAKASASAPHNE